MYLVFDVGGTFIKYALMDQKGKIYEKYKVPTPFQDGKQKMVLPHFSSRLILYTESIARNIRLRELR